MPGRVQNLVTITACSITACDIVTYGADSAWPRPDCWYTPPWASWEMTKHSTLYLYPTSRMVVPSENYSKCRMFATTDTGIWMYNLPWFHVLYTDSRTAPVLLIAVTHNRRPLGSRLPGRVHSSWLLVVQSLYNVHASIYCQPNKIIP